MDNQISKGRRLFVNILCVTVLMQLLTIVLNFNHLGLGKLFFLLIILALQGVIMFAVYRGNWRGEVSFDHRRQVKLH